jgi:hypothetical protein
MNDSTRAWSKRWQAERPGKFPNMNQAGDLCGDAALSQGDRRAEKHRRR